MGFAVFVDHRKIYGENSKDIVVIFSRKFGELLMSNP